MKTSLRKLSLFVVVFPMLLFGTSAQAAMTGAEIKAAVTGKTFVYSGPATGTINYRSNGKLAVTYTAKGKVRSKTGTWYTRDNKLCSKLVRKGSKGKKTENCNPLTNLGGGKFKSADGYTITPK